MKIIIYDCEVFSHDWLITFKDKETGQFTCVWNDNEALRQCISGDCIYIGFNSKHYDRFIVNAIYSDFSNAEIKQLNDYLIAGNQGWEYPPLRDCYFKFNDVDIKDDMQAGLSLKAIEGHLGMDIRESTVPFDLDRPLTAGERAETEFYCKHDVDTTEKLVDLRKDYLKNKINLGKLAGLSEVKALSMTNAKLTAAMLKAERKEHNDERKYVYPDNLRREYIPQEVFDFFNRMYDESLSDEEVFKGKLNLMIGECPVTVAYGGVHGAIPNFFWEETDERGIWNEDVGSFYPHLCTINHYTSRNIPSPKIYEDVLDRRMKAKAAGDKVTANALKLVCNTTYGAMLNQFNDLYDPLMGRSVCVSGQLYLLELAEHLYQEIEGLRIVQLNTDGIMVECDKSSYPKLSEICQEWQERTKFTLEEDTINKISQKDVNNYIEVQKDGSAKAKGGYLVKGIAPAGAFNINNSSVIVATALKEYLVNGTPVEQTINECNDIFQFQIIAKAGAKYREAYHMVNGEKQAVQKVNRVYATADTRYGKLFKVKAENDSEAKIEMLPEHCIIDNDNHLTIEDVDKSFYIEVAKKRINDFMGIKPERKKKMAKDTPQNVYQKLITARAKFLAVGASKSGKHMELRYKYFELDDIVPAAIGIFAEVGLVPIVNFGDEQAVMKLINTDNPEETISFVCPMRYPSENRMVNPVQALGSAMTYLRRYLYMIALDICEPDTIEPTTVKDEPATPAPKAPPATPAQREEVKKELTAPTDNATELQIKGLKAVLKKLRESQPDKGDMIAEIAVQTSGFTVITKTDCEALIERVTAMLEEKKE